MHTTRLNSSENVLFRVWLFHQKSPSRTWCAALEDLENSLSRRVFKSAGKLPCELELKGESAVLIILKQTSLLIREKVYVLKVILNTE